MKKTKTKPKPKPRAGSPAATGSGHWAKCYLEHAARETAWMAQHAKACDYAAAHDAGVRRGVWLHAALLAQEATAPNNGNQRMAGPAASPQPKSESGHSLQ